MFNYEPMSKDQAQQERFSLLKDGYYDAHVFDAIEKTSSTGNPMIEMHLKVYDDTGRPNDVRDFLVFTPKMNWKVINCAESADLAKEYSEKKFCGDLLKDKNVRVLISTQAGTEIPTEKLNGKPPGSRYPDKNVVQDYVLREGKTSVGLADFKDDEIPF